MLDHLSTSLILSDLRGIHVTSDRDDEFAEHLNRLLKRDENGTQIPEPVRFGRTKETRGILVVDAPAGGKTVLVGRGLEKHPDLLKGKHGRRPYLVSSVPSPATLKSVTFELLKQTTYEIVSSRRQVWELVEMLRYRMMQLGMCILWIDEAHDLLCADRANILRVIKSLMQGDEAVIVILSGTELLDEIVRSDPQVRRRFTVIRPATLSITEDRARFEEIAPEFCQRANLSAPTDPTWIPRLFHAARYRFGRAIEMLIDAIEQALLDDEEPGELQLHHFGAVWAMQEGHEIERNIFLVGNWERIDPDADPDEPLVIGRPSMRGRGGRRHA